jgi:hypothetical protein
VDVSELFQVNGGAMDWDKAKAHFDYVRKEYEGQIGKPGANTALALCFVFDPIADRYDDGERTKELYDKMLGVE